MFAQFLLFSAVFFTAEAFDLKNLLLNNPELQECIPVFEMFDASGKLPSGILTGNLFDLGNYDQCLNIDKLTNKSEIIKGQYCTIKIAFPMSVLTQEAKLRSFYKVFGYDFDDLLEPDQQSPKIEERVILQGIGGNPGLILGWCIPHTCLVSNLTSYLTKTLEKIDLEFKVLPLMGGMCQTKDDLVTEYDANSIILISFLCATLFLIIISTFYDMYIQYHKKKPAHIILLAFSVNRNAQKLFSVSNNADQLSCLNGIRCISMMWVVLGHRYSSILVEPVMNALVINDWMHDPINMYLLNAGVAVDSFFVLSGLLIGYGYCRAMDKGVKFNILLFYLHRYLRLTPVLAVLIWIHATIINYFGSGPFWNMAVKRIKKACSDNWWPPLIYIQNYYTYDEMCLNQTWYLAIDMQLFILSPIILIPLWRWPKQTMMASTILVLGSMASSFAVTYAYDLISFSGLQIDNGNYMPVYYYATHIRFGPWLMGLMLGYYLFKLKKRQHNIHNRITLHPSQVAFGWIFALGLLISVLYAGHDLALNSDTLGNSFFNGFHRHGWALGLCWVIYACTQGYGGPINSFLSWSLFQVLGRFTYGIYLVHFSLQYFIQGSVRTNTYFSDFRTMYAFVSDFMVSLIISVGFTLAYESPMVTIEKVLFKTGHKPKETGLPVHQNPKHNDGQINKSFEENKSILFKSK